MRTRILFVALAVLHLGRIHALAETSQNANPEVKISRTVPVISTEVELRVDLKGVSNAPATAAFIIEGDGETILRRELTASEDGIFAAKWTPQETGFYTATFDFGSDSGMGKASHEFPIVWRQLYFNTWGVLSPEEIKKVKYLCSHATVAYDMTKPPWDEAVRMLKNRGATLLSWTSGTHAIPAEKVAGGRRFTEEEVDQLVDSWSRPLKEGLDGIIMDEMGDYPSPEGMAKVDAANRALVKIRNMYPVDHSEQNVQPDKVIMPWVGGRLLREEAVGYWQSGSVILLEVYPSYFARVFGTVDCRRVLDQRIMSARASNLTWQHIYKHSAIVSLGINVDSPYEEPTLPEIEKFVRYIKKTAPEMPGIAFYGGRINEAVLKAQDRFCLDYYVKPVVDVRQINFSNYAPVAGKPVGVLVGLDNVGGMDAKGIQLKVYAAEVGVNNKKLIGEANIPIIGCGMVTVQKQDDGVRTVVPGDHRRPPANRGKSGERELFVHNGNTYSLGGEDVVMYNGRTTAKVTWTPPASGSYSIIAEVVPSPSDQYTLLDGIGEERIVVK